MKSTKLLLLLVLFYSLFIFSGCSDGMENNHQNFDLIASEKTLPENMDEIAFLRKETPYFQYFVRKAENQSDFENIWNLYKFKNQEPKLDFSEKSAFFIGLHESGGCPSKIEKVETSSYYITITIAHPGGNCIADATPRTFAFKIGKEKSKDIETIVIFESGTETRMPLEN